MNIFSFLNPSKNTDTAQKDMEEKNTDANAGKKPHKKPSVSLHSKDETVDFDDFPPSVISSISSDKP